jgi:hypothetical protein
VRGGKPIPPDEHGEGLLDTGSDRSFVDAGVAHRLSLPRIGRSDISSVMGPRAISAFEYWLTVVLYDRAEGRRRHVLRAAECQLEHLGYAVVLGWDVLNFCKFVYDGPGKTFTLDF